MKFIFYTFILFFSNFIFSQNSNEVIYNTDNSIRRASNSSLSSYGSAVLFHNPAKKIIGTEYLFDKWNNSAVLYTNTNNNFIVKNVNININRNSFEAKISQDSIFSFNFNNIEKIVINNRVFKNIYSSDGKNIYEVIYETKAFSILKDYKVELVSGSPNPMVNRKNDKYVRKVSYVVLKNNQVSPFKLKKSKILKLFNDQKKVTKLEEYMNSADLSYKKEGDVIKALKYIFKG